MENNNQPIPSSDVPHVRLDQPQGREEEVVFTSPLTLKVYEEVKKKRVKEVDLETGRKTSHVEEERYEVLDLTGDTPGRRGSQRTPLQPLASLIPEAANTSNLRPSLKSPRPYLDQSVVCLSHTWDTGRDGSMAPPATPRLRPSLVSAGGRSPLVRARGARASKYPLLR